MARRSPPMRLAKRSTSLASCHFAQHPATFGVHCWQIRQGEANPPIPQAAAPTAFLEPSLSLDKRRQFSILNRFVQDWKTPASLQPAMSTDAEYEAFLEKTNQDAKTGGNSMDTAEAAPQSRSSSIITVNTAVPAALQDVEEYYMSDADEPFEPVSLKWTEKDIPSADKFKELVRHNAQAVAQSEADFDPRHQYKRIIRTVKEAGNGNAVIFKIQDSNTRAAYYIVSLDEEGGRLVGLKAMAIES